MADDGTPRVVVGVDGSKGGDVALRYALQEAARRGADVDVVSAWEPPIRSLAETFGLEPYDRTRWDSAHERAAHEHVDQVLAEEPGGAERRVEVHARTGRPADILVEAARGADLLVVGHRGRGGVSGVALGSVGLHCVMHAPCPVLVVPTDA